MLPKSHLSTRNVLIAVGALLALTPAMSPAAPGRQEVRGSVVAPVGADAWCSVLEASARWATNQRGLFAHSFGVNRSTNGRPFVLTPDLPADIDIFFSGSEVFPDLAERGLGAERGTVPAGARAATVCLFAGPPTGFTYVAG